MAASEAYTLDLLRERGSTSRFYNVLRLHNVVAGTAAPGTLLFRNRLLCKSIICKVTLSPTEASRLKPARRRATKVILPLNAYDLRLGGRYFYMGQGNYDQIGLEVWGESKPDREHDEAVLALMDQAPSLDPFLLREYLQRGGIQVDPGYFDLSEHDLRSMHAYVKDEITALVRIAFGADAEITELAPRVADRILFSQEGAESEPLRLTLRLDPESYREGIFCWKGFLYFKWLLARINAGLGPALARIRDVLVQGSPSAHETAYIDRMRERIPQEIAAASVDIAEIVKRYDAAFAGLVGGGNPVVFRDFLLQSPRLFAELGERVGVVEHILAIWAMQFPDSGRAALAAGPLTELFSDFEQTLSAFRDARSESVRRQTA